MKKIFTATAFLTCMLTAAAQFSDLVGKGTKLLDKGLTGKLQKHPITTSFSDCKPTEILPIEFGKDSLKKLLCKQTFVADSGYKLSTGFYKGAIKSFCLKAGTFAPSKGDGYLYAPLKGPKEELVFKLINNWYNHKEIPQQNVQLLLWAIIAKTKINHLGPELKATAVALLSDNDRDELSKAGLDMVGDIVIKRIAENLPEPAKTVVEIENRMRSKFYQTTVNYNEMESLAMLAGVSNEKPLIERGLWTLLPNGIYARYLPQGYSRTDIELYVPAKFKGMSIYFKGPGQIAMPANQGSQRLAQSNLIICADN